jgi:hypothetical protein
MIHGGASLIEGPIKRDLVLACEMGSLRRLLEASGLAFRTLSLDLEENTPNQELLETLGVTDAADVAELLARTRIEEALRAPLERLSLAPIKSFRSTARY